MVTNRRRKIILILIIFLTAMGVFSLVNFDVAKNSYENIHSYSYERTYVNNDGETLDFYQSGDYNFTYFHDKYGNILLEEDGNIVYAENIDGKPEPGTVAYSNNRILKHPSMSFEEIDFEKHPNLYLNYLDEPIEEEITKNQNLAKYRGTITNIIIFIKFKNENPIINANYFNNIFNSSTSASLNDYFYEMSNGNINVSTIMPYLGTALYVYEAPNSRDYYNVGGNDFRRQTREAELLANAVSAASNYLDTSNLNLDIDNDDRVDSVTFMVNGSPSTSWGSLLWPHSWNLFAIAQNNLSLREKSKIGDTYIGQYAFQFVDTINLGVLCHEFGHVLGAPDLYHYNNDFAPVDAYDLMHRNLDNPQYMTAYMRDKYIHSISHQIEEINQNGYYSLPPVTAADNDDIIAYKIPTSVSNEFLMVEYRTNKVGGYDNQIPGSGLLVYRITETSSTMDKGNSDSTYQSPNRPDLLYVYRPRVYSTGRETSDTVRLANSRNDLKHALLNPQNQYFSAVGTPITNTKTYDYESLFLSNGKNTGIVIETVEMSDSSISFYIKVNPSDNVENDYFKDKILLESSKSIAAPFTGINTSLSFSTLDLNKLVKLSVKYKNEASETVAESVGDLALIKSAYSKGIYNFYAPYVFNSKGQIITDPFDTKILLNEKPIYADLYIVDSDNDEVFISRKNIDFSDISYESLLQSKSQPIPQLSSSYYLTLALDFWGKVYATGEQTDEQWAVSGFENIINISAGYKHSLLLDKDGTPHSVGSNIYGEGSFNINSPISDIAAGYFNSYLVDIYGKVYAFGNNTYNQLLINGATNVKNIFAGEKNVVAIKNDGSLIGYGDNSFGQLNFSSTIKAKEVAIGLTFIAVLTEDNNVEIFGNLADKNLLLKEKFVKISASNDNLALIKTDLTPLVLGNNSFNQTDTDGLIDIIDVSCGKFTVSYLRKDGEIEHKGVGDDYYGTNDSLPNLNYKENEYILLKDFNHSSIDSLISNETFNINLSFTPYYATYKGVVFYSSNPNVATVSLDGLITAHENGQTTITMVAKSQPTLKKSFNLSVYQEIKIVSIFFNDSNIEIIKDAEINLVVLLNPLDANEEYHLEFASSDPSVVKIDKYGKIIGVGYGTANITANATVNNDGQTKTFHCAVTVTVVSEVVSITFKTPPTTDYFYGESLRLEELSLTILRKDGDDTVTSSKNVTLDMVFNYDRHKIDSQTIEIRYLDKTLYLTINVHNYIVDINISEGFPPNKIFLAEEIFDVGKNAKLVEIYANGNTKSLPLTNDMVTGYDTSIIGLHKLNVHYKNFSTEYYVEVKDKVVGISLDSPEKILNYGENLTDNQILNILMYSGDVRYTELEKENIIEFDNKIVGKRPVIITYLDELSQQYFTATVPVTVELASGELILSPNKNLHYFVLGTLPTFEISYKTDNFTFSLSTEGNLYYKLTSFDMSSVERQKIIAQLYVKSFDNDNLIMDKLISSLDIIVKGYPSFSEPTFDIINNEFDFEENVTIENADKIRMRIKEGDNFRYLTDNEVTLEYSLEILNETQIMTINYCDNIFEVNILIRDNPISIEEITDKTIYLYEELFFDVFLIMQSGNIIQANDNYLEFSYINSTLGSSVAVVRYLKIGDDGTRFDFESHFNLLVKDKEVSIKVVTPITQEYRYGEKINLNSKYMITYLSEKSINIDFSDELFIVSILLDNLAVGTHILKLTYIPLNFDFTYTLTITNYCLTLKFEKDTIYIYQKLDKPKVFLKATMANGEINNITAAHTVNNFSSNAIGIFDFTFKYLDCTIKESFEIVLNIDSLSFNSLPKKLNLGYGESLDMSGAELIYITTDNITGRLVGNEIKRHILNFDSLKSGVQTIIVKLGFKTVDFSITIGSNINLLNIINGKNISVDNKSKIISLQEELDYSKFIDSLSRVAYLKIVIEKTANENVASFDKLKMINNDDTVVAEYVIYLKGDGNGDGYVNIDDLDSLAKLFVSNKILYILDINGDKTITLSDIITFSLKYNDKVPPPSHEFFKILVCDIKKEDL